MRNFVHTTIFAAARTKVIINAIARIALAALSMLASAGLAFADDSPKLSRQTINRAGWAIPGLEKIGKLKPPAQPTDFALGGKTISFRTYRLSRESRPRGVIVPLIFVTDDSVVIKEQRILPSQIKEYSLDGIVFCYVVEATPWVPDGVAGILIYFAYYNDDKDGKFKVLEFPDPIAAVGKPVEPIRLPAWAR